MGKSGKAGKENKVKKMKQVFLIVCLVGLFLISSVSAAPAVGDLFGALSTAEAVGQGRGDFGAGLGLGDHMNSFFGTFKYGVSRFGTLGFQLGMVDPDRSGLDSKLSFGASFAYQIWGLDEPDVKHPFDMSFGGFFQIYSGDIVDYVYLGGFVTGSYPFVMKNGSRLTPYVRFNVRSEKIDYAATGSSSSLKFGLNMGTAWELTKSTNLYGEIQLDGNDGLFFGIDFNVM